LISPYTAIERTLWPKGFGRNIWMIVDCARDQQKIFRFLLSCHLEYKCLYSGHLPPVLEMAAPYLIQLDCESEETRRLIDMSWGNSWGIFLRSDTNMVKLRRHLREFLLVRDTQGRRLAFRYYDPRVLRTYLPTCVSEELRTVFGPVDRYWTEAAGEPDQLLEFRFERSRLVQETRLLTEEPEDVEAPSQAT